ncbi:MAG: TlyA family RNA methyltransferase [Acidobacteria bacterium]|nr:TlyA family RNA methyltransferase [Acidobacteriota bacterium]
MNKRRLDAELVARGLAENRSKGQALIMSRRVSVNDEIVAKAGFQVRQSDEIAVAEPEHPWVGRGGVKLAHALERFSVDPGGLVCADIGASTGGFTHVLLEKGAARVYAIDVGYGQLDIHLRNDPRVVVMERVNARYLDEQSLPEPVSLVSIDVSFISLRHILPAALRISSPGARIVTLIKPQFEVGREHVGKGGIVRDADAREQAVSAIIAFAESLGLSCSAREESPIRGAEGNVEVLALFETANP